LTYAGPGIEAGTRTVFVVTRGEAGELDRELTAGSGDSPSGAIGDALLAAGTPGEEAAGAESSASASGAEELVSAGSAGPSPPAEGLAAPESLAA
jgi:hypothetical protein